MNNYSVLQEIQDLKDHGYTLENSLRIIEVAALREIANCVVTGYDGKPYLRISGSVATYEQ